MKFGILSVVLSVAQQVTLEDVYGSVDQVMYMEPWSVRASQPSTKISDVESYFGCSLPLDLMLILDTTKSFHESIKTLLLEHISKLTEILLELHPGSQIGLVSYRDKPIGSLGDPLHDYCSNLDACLSDDNSALLDIINRLEGLGGGDPPHNQFGALIAATSNDTLGWRKKDSSVRVALMVTSSTPHFEGDGFNDYDLTAFNENKDYGCTDSYYPTPEQVKNALTTEWTYLGTLVNDHQVNGFEPLKSWEWFNRYINQTEEFCQELKDDFSNFSDQISKIIETVKSVECTGHSSSSTDFTALVTTTALELSTITSGAETTVTQILSSQGTTSEQQDTSATTTGSATPTFSGSGMVTSTTQTLTAPTSDSTLITSHSATSGTESSTPMLSTTPSGTASTTSEVQTLTPTEPISSTVVNETGQATATDAGSEIRSTSQGESADLSQEVDTTQSDPSRSVEHLESTTKPDGFGSLEEKEGSNCEADGVLIKLRHRPARLHLEVENFASV